MKADRLIHYCTQFLLGFVFSLAGLAKLMDFRSFHESFANYPFLTPPEIAIISICVPALEVTIGACFLFGNLSQDVYLITLILSLSFISISVYLIGHGLRGGCGCFGGALSTSENTYWMLARNLTLGATVGLAYWNFLRLRRGNVGASRSVHRAIEDSSKCPQEASSLSCDNRVRAFTLLELMVVIAIIGVLAALLMSALPMVKERGNRTVCLNNQRQLTLALIIYGHDDPHGKFWKGDSRSWPVMDANWLAREQKLSVNVFFCPSTKNGQRVKQGRAADGSSFYPALNMVALNRNSFAAYSYDVLAWFADMENYWNGNRESARNSRFIPKTTTSILAYTHLHEAFSLRGKVVGPSQIWLLTDNCVITPEPFWPDANSNHGPAGAITSFVDGHASWIPQNKYVLSYELSQDNNRTRAVPRPSI